MCDIDPFSKCLLKRCIDKLIHPITTIINMSMQNGVVPDDFKHALVNRLNIKWTKELSDYLKFVSKVLEKVIANRLSDHISSQHLSNEPLSV